MAKLLLLHGPNLNLLGEREPEQYGTSSLDLINQRVAEVVTSEGHSIECFQSNAEHELIERVQAASKEGVQFIIINPAAFTHTSIALRDALLAVAIPCIEVHLSNVFRREPFRQQSYFSDIAAGVIAGLGPQGYELAAQAAVKQLASGGN